MLDPASSRISNIDPPSSPTETKKKRTVKDILSEGAGKHRVLQHEDEDDETLPEFNFAAESLAATKRDQAESAKRRLQEIKQMAIKAQLAAGRNVLPNLSGRKTVGNPKGTSKDGDEEDDLDIISETPIKTKPLSVKTDKSTRRGPDAKAVLAYNSTSSVPAYSRTKLQQLSHAGLPARPLVKADITETYAAYAGTTFDHANHKNSNSGAAPTGMKEGRDIPISGKEFDELVKQRHALQVLKERQRKETIYGKGKGLPERKEWDLKGLASQVEESERRREERERQAMEEEDEEDVEWVPGEEERGEEVHSGEEDADGSGGEEVIKDVDGEQVKDDEDEAELVPTEGEEDDDDVPVVSRRKHRPTARVVDSDDEGEAQQRSKLPQPASAMPSVRAIVSEPSMEIDLAGFGDSGGGGSPGFSQLFEATQMATNPAKTTQKVSRLLLAPCRMRLSYVQDGFAGLRDRAPMDLLPAHALLPGVDISETQARRDDALIAAEIDAVMESVPPSLKKPAPQYLNDQG
jgi:mediator of replication checkpoint protein 1